MTTSPIQNPQLIEYVSTCYLTGVLESKEEEYAANTVITLVKENLEEILKQEKCTFNISHFTRAASAHIFENDPDKIKSFLNEIISKVKNQIKIDSIKRISRLFEVVPAFLFLVPSKAFITPTALGTQPAASFQAIRTFSLLCIKLCQDIVCLTSLSISPDLYETQGSIPIGEFQSTLSFRSRIKIGEILRKNGSALHLIFRSLTTLGEGLTPASLKLARCIGSMDSLKPAFSFIRRITEIFYWSINQMEKNKSDYYFFIRARLFLLQPGICKQIKTLETLSLKNPERFNFETCLIAQIEKSEIANTQKLDNIKDKIELILNYYYLFIRTRLQISQLLIKMIDQEQRTSDALMNSISQIENGMKKFLDAASQIEDIKSPSFQKELMLVQPLAPISTANMPRSINHATDQIMRNLSALTKHLVRANQTLDEPVEEMVSPQIIEDSKEEVVIERSSIEQLQVLRQALRHYRSSLPQSNNISAAFWHLNSILIRLSDISYAPKTHQNLLALIAGLANDACLALEQILISLGSSKEPTHHLVDLYYRIDFANPPSEEVFQIISRFHGGELLTRRLSTCIPRENHIEDLLHKTWNHAPPHQILSEAVAFVGDLMKVTSLLCNSKRPLPDYEKALSKLQSECTQFQLQNPPSGQSSLAELQKNLEQRFSSIFSESMKKRAENVTGNFLARLRAIEERLHPLQPVYASLALSDSRLLTQMAGESLFYLLLDLKGEWYDKKEIDHNLMELIRRLDLDSAIFTPDELLFLSKKKGKEIRQRMRYPDDRDVELKSAITLAEKHLIDTRHLVQEGFHLVGPDEVILSRTKNLIKNNLNIFISICNKVINNIKISEQ